jgi:hypothetical protein
MSIGNSQKLWLRPFDEIDTNVPECGIIAMPGKVAAVSHPLNEGRDVLFVDRESFDPDLAVVVSSGTAALKPGQVIVMKPDKGAYYPGLSDDGREVRMVGVHRPWWEDIMCVYSENGLAPTPGWMLIKRDTNYDGPIELPGKERYASHGTCIASCGENWSSPHEGEKVCFEGLETFTFSDTIDESWCLVRAGIASRKWLSSLRRAI